MSKEQIEEMAEDLRYCHTEYIGDYGDIYTDYNKTAEKLAVIGYRKQKEGEWEEISIPVHCEDDADIIYRCSSCGSCSDSETNFCWNCGAKMKGGAE